MTEAEAIKIIENVNNPKDHLEIALLVLSHSGKAKALKAIEKFIFKRLNTSSACRGDENIFGNKLVRQEYSVGSAAE